jgi:enoyl-CoA hydratase/carnithine racemase
MQQNTVKIKTEANIRIISLNRPAVLNAINTALVNDFLAALKEAENDKQIRIVVINGEGRAFCAGDDLSEEKLLDIDNGFRHIDLIQDITITIMRMSKPVIAAIHGYALGAGCEWAMNCDLRIAAEGTKFGFPETSVGGTITNAGTKILPLLVGLGRAKYLTFTCEMIDARKAEEWGLINQVVNIDELEATVIELATQIASNSAASLLFTKRAINQGISQHLEQVLEQETRDAMIVFSSNEAVERAKIALKKTKEKHE